MKNCFFLSFFLFKMQKGQVLSVIDTWGKCRKNKNGEWIGEDAPHQFVSL